MKTLRYSVDLVCGRNCSGVFYRIDDAGTCENVRNPMSCAKKYSSFVSGVPEGFLKTVAQFSSPHQFF